MPFHKKIGRIFREAGKDFNRQTRREAKRFDDTVLRQAREPFIDLYESTVSFLKPEIDLPSLDIDSSSGLLLNKKGNDINIPIVYGTSRVGGTRIFVGTSGTSNQFLWIALLICEGEISAIRNIYVNNILCSDTQYKYPLGGEYQTGTVSVTNGSKIVTGSGTTFVGNVSVDDIFSVFASVDFYYVVSVDSNTQLTLDVNFNGTTASGKQYLTNTSLIVAYKHNGADDQTVDTNLDNAFNTWGSSYRLRGLAYLVLKIRFLESAFSGFPNVTCDVDGKITLDTRSTIWTEQTNPKNVGLLSIVHSGGLYVAVGNPDGTDAYIVTSTDAIAWTERSNPKNIALNSVTSSNSLYVAVGEPDGTDAYIVTSTDAITWTERSNPKNISLFGIINNNGFYVAVGAGDGTDAYILTSVDGIAWTERSNPKNIALRDIEFANGFYVAVGDADGVDAYIVTSVDAITWVEQTNPVNFGLKSIVNSGGIFVAVGDANGFDAYIITSIDGVTWIQQANPKNFGLRGIEYGNGLFVAVGDADGVDAYIITSVDAITWVEQTNQKNFRLYALTFQNGEFVALGLPDGSDAYLITTSGNPLFSSNPAFAIRDYLLNARYGKGLLEASIDSKSFNDAADTSDFEIVSHALGANIKRFEINGSVQTQRSIVDNLKLMLTSCRARLPFCAGKYTLKIEKSESSVFVFDKTNIIGAWSFSGASKNEKLNIVKSRFINAFKSYQKDIVISKSASYLTADNEKILERTINLTFENNVYRAKYHADVVLKNSRQGLRVGFVATIESLKSEVGDVVQITHDTPGWINKNFRITNMSILSSLQVAIDCIEYDSTVYDRTVPAIEDAEPATTLPNPNIVTVPTGLTATQKNVIRPDGSMDNQITLSWTAALDTFVNDYDVQYKISSSSIWQSAPVARGSTTVLIVGFDTLVDYDFQIRSHNTIGAVSTWVQVNDKTIIDVNYIYYQTFFDSLDGLTINLPAQVVIDGSGISINVINTDVTVDKVPSQFASATWSNDRIFKARAKITTSSSNNFQSIGMGDDFVKRRLHFTINSLVVNAVSYDGTTETENVSIFTMALGTFYNFEIRLDASAGAATYYIDNVLKSTITTNIPSGTVDADALFTLDAGKTDPSDPDFSFVISNISFLQKN